VESPALDSNAWIGHLSLRQFRNYEELDLDLSSGIHILSGANAQGKTNLLEALYLASSTRLLRGMRDTEAIMEGRERSQVTVQLAHTQTEISVKLDRTSRKKVTVNGASLPRASDVLGRLPCVCVSSVDLPIVSGEPSDRRLFLDLELSQLFSAYLQHLSVYKRALEHRNALLRAGQETHVPGEQFEQWEEQMSQHGADLRAIRNRFLAGLNPHAQNAHKQIGSGETIQVCTQPKDEAETSDELRKLLVDLRSKDVARGSTSAGPHRDDFRIEIDGRDARLYGSQGQQRTAMLSIKLGTMELEQGERGKPPLLLLDDILSDLDENRRAMLMRWVLEHGGQTILTCTEPTAAGKAILEKARVLHVANGEISEA